MKKSNARRKNLSGKALATIITFLVFLGSITLVVLTVFVFMHTLSNVATARKSDTTKSAKLAGIDGTLLDALLKFHADRNSRTPLDTSHLNNPFQALPLPETAAAAPQNPAPPAPTATPPAPGPGTPSATPTQPVK